MVELTNTAAQIIAPGQVVTFNKVIKNSGCGECYRDGSNSVKLKYNGTYKVEFSGNVSGTTANAPVQLAIAQGGVALPETVMVSTPAVVGAFNNIATGTYVTNSCCDFDRITVVNSGTIPVTLSANMNLRIRRVS